MKKLKYDILFTILFMTIGIAAVVGNMSIDGSTPIASNTEDFDIYFSDIVSTNNILDLKEFSSNSFYFWTGLTALNQEGKIDFVITNASQNYDANVDVVCTYDSEYVSVTTHLDDNVIAARSDVNGYVSVKMIKSYIGNDSNIDFTCNLTYEAIERTNLSINNDYSPELVMLKSTYYEDDSYFRSSTYKEKIKTITFQDTINVPGDAIESWDIGVAQNGNVMAYVVPNVDDSTYYDLYIQSDEQLYANYDMLYWFSDFVNLDSINNIELLDTSKVISMALMFNKTGYNSQVFDLDVSSLDTSNVEVMLGTFQDTGYSNPDFELDISGWTTSKVYNMVGMFNRTGYNSKVLEIDLNGFDTSNVVDMNIMFQYAGYSNPDFSLDVSKFNTAKVKDMSYMFFGAGYNSQSLVLDCSNFDTSKVTNMVGMFTYVGYEGTGTVVNVSGFDTKKVTNMDYMFAFVGFNNPNFVLDLSSFDTRNVTSMFKTLYATGLQSSKFKTSLLISNPNITDYSEVFYGVAAISGSELKVNYTSETSDLVDLMIATKYPGSNVVKGDLIE